MDVVRCVPSLYSCRFRLQVSTLDSWLSDAQGADLLAFQALVEARLEPATVYTTWVEQHSYSSHTAVSASKLHVFRQMASSTDTLICKVYTGCCSAR